MQKPISFILISIILSAMVAAKKGQYHPPQYMVPISESFIECTRSAFLIAKRAATEAVKSKSLQKDFNKINLDHATCEYTLGSGYDWFKLTFDHEDQTCTIYVVASWTPWVLQRDETRFALNKEFTLRANKELGKCEEHATTYAGKLFEDEAAEELSNDDEVHAAPAVEQLSNEEEVHASPAVEQLSNVEEVHAAPAVEEVHTAPAVEHFTDVHTNEEATVETTNQDVFFGPGNIALPLRPKKALDAPARHHLLEEEDIEEAPKGMMVGGWRDCNASEKSKVLTVFGQLISQDKIKSIHIYQQNIAQCKAQLVNGMNYNVLLSFNGQHCRLAFHEEFKGQISLFNGAPSLGDFKECAEALSSK
jgi:hypothetical protein